MGSPRWREWSEDERMRSRARAAYLFMNIVPCPDCGLDWPEGFVHEGCDGPLPEGPFRDQATADADLDEAERAGGAYTVRPSEAAARRRAK